MYPAIRPGDSLILSPVPACGPRPGDVAVCRRHGRLIAHRVMAVGAGEIVTAADAGGQPDPPLPLEAVVAMVSGVRRSQSQGTLRSARLALRLARKLVGRALRFGA